MQWDIQIAPNVVMVSAKRKRYAQLSKYSTTLIKFHMVEFYCYLFFQILMDIHKKIQEIDQ